MTLPRRRWLAAACVGVAALMMVGPWLWRSPGTGALLRWYDRIQVGMSAAEAQALLERALRDDEWQGERRYAPPDANQQLLTYWELDRSGREPEIRGWPGDDGAITLTFAEGKVAAKSWQRRIPTWRVNAERWLAYLRGLVGL